MIRPRNPNAITCLAVLATLFAANTAAAGPLVSLQNPLTITDWSGIFTIIITSAESTQGLVDEAGASCSPNVPITGSVLIGGGGAVDDAQGNAGALLVGAGPANFYTTASNPFFDDGSVTSTNASWATWFATTKDANYVYRHRSRCYAIWLKVAGLSDTTLNRYLKYVFYGTDDAKAVAGQQDRYTPTFPSNYTLIGGGGGVFKFFGAGNYLVASEPDVANNRWHVMTKDHGVSSSSTIKYGAVGIDLNALRAEQGIDAEVVVPPMVGTIPLGGTWPSGYILTTRWWDTSSSSRSAITAIGGRAYYKGNGRIINNLGFTSDASHKLGVTVYTKDHQYSDSGFNTLSWIGIRKRTSTPPIIMY